MHKKTIFFVLLLVIVVLLFAFSTKKDSAPLAPVATPTEEVVLNNGDVYKMTAGYVTKDVGGKPMRMLAYNGSIPGPTIRVNEGDEVTIRFVNNTDMPTLFHSHGVRMENKFDGSQSVQSDILPGESFEYKLKFADPGVMWYHPHVREDKQQNMGLYGNFVVTPKDPNFWPQVDGEETLFLSDVLIEGEQIAPYSDKFVTHALMGRFGNTLLANGEVSHVINAAPGEVYRLYVTNAATVRPFNFAVKGAKMKLVGGDNGRYEKETFVESVVVAPSERAVLDVHFPEAGTYALENRTPTKAYELGRISVDGTRVSVASVTFETLRNNQEEIKLFSGLRRYLTTKPDEHITLTMKMDMAKIMSHMGSVAPEGGHAHGGAAAAGHDMAGMDMASTSAHMSTHTAVPIEWEDTMGDMNTFSTSDTVTWIIKDVVTGKENMDINWKFTLGSYVKIRIDNDPNSGHPMQHPVHFHGNRFAVLSTNGVPNDNMVWKDTTQLKTGESIDILLEVTNPGIWMAHCHIAEHMHSGMMFNYTVQP